MDKAGRMTFEGAAAAAGRFSLGYNAGNHLHFVVGRHTHATTTFFTAIIQTTVFGIRDA